MNISFALKILNKLNSKFIWDLYSWSSKRLLNETYFILSFDCDTAEDAAVAWDVHKRLMDMGIMAVYAIPGELLKQGEKVYRKIFESGAQFINHGGREHTYFNIESNRHASCFFYDQQSLEVVKEDILLGHKTLYDVLGIRAEGWRTPHFGTFQKTQQLDFLYSILNDLQYKFSSSTVPLKAFQCGPAYEIHGLTEIPVTGIFNEPFNILDTWAYFGAPDCVRSPDDYLKACRSLADFASCKPLLINVYGDPSHVFDKKEFFEGMKSLAKISKNINYSDLVGIINGNIRDL